MWRAVLSVTAGHRNGVGRAFFSHEISLLWADWARSYLYRSIGEWRCAQRSFWETQVCTFGVLLDAEKASAIRPVLPADGMEADRDGLM